MALIGVNAVAAAGSFVAGVFLAAAADSAVSPLIVVLGLVGLGYFLRRAEEARGGL